jgi:drug/metabolite transporter (DMT)-like permease
VFEPKKTTYEINKSRATPSVSSSTMQSHIWMIVFSLIIAGSFLVSASITIGIDSTVLTFWRFLTATTIFALMLPFANGFQLPGWRDLGRYSIVGGSYGLFFILMFQALKDTTPLNTSTIYTILPLLTMLLGRLLGEALHVRQMGILALSMVATIWVIFRGDWHQMIGLQFSRGDIIFFIGTGCLAVYMQSMKRLQRNESKIYFTFYSLLIATVALLVTVLVRTEALIFPSIRVWLGIFYLAGPSTAGTFWILQYTAPRLGPNRVVAYTFLTPSAVAGLEWGLGLSSPEWSLLPGIGLTLAAVWLLQLDVVTKDRLEML